MSTKISLSEQAVIFTNQHVTPVEYYQRLLHWHSTYVVRF